MIQRSFGCRFSDQGCALDRANDIEQTCIGFTDDLKGQVLEITVIKELFVIFLRQLCYCAVGQLCAKRLDDADLCGDELIEQIQICLPVRRAFLRVRRMDLFF